MVLVHDLCTITGPQRRKGSGTHRALFGSCWLVWILSHQSDSLHGFEFGLPCLNDALSWCSHDMSARCVPDPFLLLGVGSGDETSPHCEIYCGSIPGWVAISARERLFMLPFLKILGSSRICSDDRGSGDSPGVAPPYHGHQQPGSKWLWHKSARSVRWGSFDLTRNSQK